MKKLAATQALLQPLVYVPFFFLFHGLLIGEMPGESLHRLYVEYFALLLRLWSLFMPTRMLMFLMVPPRYQVLWDSSVSFFWQVALSLFDAARGHVQLHLDSPDGVAVELLATTTISGAAVLPLHDRLLGGYVVGLVSG